MKKKNVLAAIAVLVLVGTLFVTGCKNDPEEKKEDPKRDTSWLVGAWANTAGVEFTIAADMTFTCDLALPIPDLGSAKARALGKLDYSSSGLGDNDYLLTDMRAAAAGVPDETYVGNEFLGMVIVVFNDLKVTLTPNSAKSQFTFSTTDTIANQFFGGTFTKK